MFKLGYHIITWDTWRRSAIKGGGNRGAGYYRQDTSRKRQNQSGLFEVNRVLTRAQCPNSINKKRGPNTRISAHHGDQRRTKNQEAEKGKT